MKNTYTFFLSIAFIFNVTAQNRIPIDEQLINTTIKIEIFEKVIIDGKIKYKKSSGTGFFFSFRKDKTTTLPVIVTNKHVIRHADQGILYFKLADSSGNPVYGKSVKVSFGSFNKLWITHPDTSVDLAILFLLPIVDQYKKEKGKDLFFVTIPEELITSDSTAKTLTAIEEITMIGYPYGLRDTLNDVPIVRRGITATPIFLNYNLKKEFLIDMPVFFGSSGSPIFIYNQGNWSSRTSTQIGTTSRVVFVGINYATYTKDFDGKILPIKSDYLEDTLKVITPLPLYNIGVIIKSQRLLEFKPILKMN